MLIFTTYWASTPPPFNLWGTAPTPSLRLRLCLWSHAKLGTHGEMVTESSWLLHKGWKIYLSSRNIHLPCHLGQSGRRLFLVSVHHDSISSSIYLSQFCIDGPVDAFNSLNASGHQVLRPSRFRLASLFASTKALCRLSTFLTRPKYASLLHFQMWTYFQFAPIFKCLFFRRPRIS